MSSSQRRATSLDGVRVLDLTTFLSGPFGTQMLADIGADVIKVESPSGDDSRSIPPHFVGDDSAYYLSVNRNKRSIAIDMKTTRGLALARRLIAASDVVVENFRPGVCARLGIDPAAMRAANPALIWASITGFGNDDPWRDRGAYDMIVQAASGIMSLTGEPGGPPVRLGIPAGDLVAGMYAVVGILAALHERDRTGLGRTIDVSMFDSMLTMLSYQASYSLNAGVTPPPQGSGHDSFATYRTFRAGDDRVVAVTAVTDQMWRSVCEVLGLPELVEDERFVDRANRLQHSESLWEIWGAAFRTRPADEWVRRLHGVGVPASTVRTVPEALADSETAGRGMVLDLKEDDRVARLVGNPIRMDGEQGSVHRFPPRLGADAEQILHAELGLTDDEISELRSEGAIRSAPQLARSTRPSS